MAAICVVLLSAVAVLGHWLGAIALHHSDPLRRYTGVGDVVLYVLLGLTAVALLTALGSAIIASSTGWRRIIDPGWHDPVSAYHGHYVIPYPDMDEKARSVWVRVVNARRRILQSRVVAKHLIDSIRVSVILPQHIWEISRDLAELSLQRAWKDAILKGANTGDSGVARALDQPQRELIRRATAIEHRVRSLEAFADRVEEADAARRNEQAVRDLHKLNQYLVEQAARQPFDDNDLAPMGPLSQELAAVIEQSKEAIRRANEAGRTLVIPSEHSAI